MIYVAAGGGVGNADKRTQDTADDCEKGKILQTVEQPYSGSLGTNPKERQCNPSFPRVTRQRRVCTQCVSLGCPPGYKGHERTPMLGTYLARVVKKRAKTIRGEKDDGENTRKMVANLLIRQN